MKTAMNTPWLALPLRLVFSLLLLAMGLAAPAPAPALAQGTVEVYATGFVHPIGVAVDSEGQVWVAEQGTGTDDARVLVVTTDREVYPFLEGMRSEPNPEAPEGLAHLRFVGGELWVAQGLGTAVPEGYLLREDPAGYAPGGPPRGPADVDASYDVGAFALGEGFAGTNLYNLTVGPDGDLFLVDAGANALFRRDADTGALSVFATFPPAGGSEAVPTGIVFAGDRFYVSGLSGVPYAPGRARVYAVDAATGDVSVFRDGLTMLTDIAVDPRDGRLVVSQILDPTGGFRPGTGGVFKLYEGGGVDTLAYGLTYVTGIAFADDGTLYVASGFPRPNGELLRITSPPVASDPEAPDAPADFALLGMYPNPSTTHTTIGYRLARPAPTVLAVYDLLGRSVATLVDEARPAGPGTATWDGRGEDGRRVGAGLYLVRLQVGAQVQSRKVTLLR